jgi:putative hemolysin
MRATQGVVKVALVLVLCGFSLQAVSQTATTKTVTPAAEPAATYCTQSGGQFEARHAVFGTNNDPQSWLWLKGEESFCQYTSSDGSRIHLSLETLASTKPTLAALAYYAEVPWNGQGNGNPASFYCTQIGGSEIGATEFSGGAWVSKAGIDRLLEACIFPDNSSIDSWGLLYHSAGIIRGTDLSSVLKYANPFPPQKKKNKVE